MVTMQIDREKRPTALITGGSRGIGFALAKQFARHGHDLILVSRNRLELESAADVLRGDYGCSVMVMDLDLTVNGATERLASQLKGQAVSVDVLVNNAGLGDHGPFAES